MQHPARRRVWRDERGATALEFAFIGLILITMLLGVVELGRYYITAQSLRSVTADAARAGIVSANNTLIGGGTCPTTLAADKPGLLQRVPVLLNVPLTITLTVDCGSNPKRITANTTYGFSFLVPFLPSGSITLTGRTTLDFP